MRDVQRIRERAEIRMDRIQAVWLALGAAIALGVMFALGVVVGRRAARIEPAPPAANPLAEIRENERVMHSFYESLSGSATPLPAEERPSSTEPTPPARRAASAAQNDAAAQTTTRRAAPAVAPQRAARSDRGSVREALDAGPPSRGDYTLQVSAFETEAEARAFAAALERKGFSPFVRQADIPGKGTWYRVRMGKFASEKNARRAKSLLNRSDIPAWVLRAE
jgi:septal ring-binding cell division protein DamX